MFSSRDNRLHARYINGIPVGEWLMQQPEWVEVFERIKPTYLGMTVTCRYNGYDESTSTYYTRRSTVVDVDMGAHGNGVWLVVASREFGKLVRLPGYAIVVRNRLIKTYLDDLDRERRARYLLRSQLHVAVDVPMD